MSRILASSLVCFLCTTLILAANIKRDEDFDEETDPMDTQGALQDCNNRVVLPTLPANVEHEDIFPLLPPNKRIVRVISTGANSPPSTCSFPYTDTSISIPAGCTGTIRYCLQRITGPAMK